MQLHPTSLPGGRLGPEAYAFVDWLHEAGARWWQVLPLTPPDTYGSPYTSASAFAGWGGLLAEPEAPGRPRRGARVPCEGGRLARRLGGVRGRGRARGAGALRARMGRASRVCRRSWSAGRRRRPDLRRGRGLRPRRASRALPAARRGRRRRAAGRPQRARSALGKPALRLGRARADGVPVVDRPDAPRARARRPLPDRPLPRLRRVLGGAGARRERPRGGMAAWPGPGGVRRGAGGARRPPRRRRGPGRDHAGRPRSSATPSASRAWP